MIRDARLIPHTNFSTTPLAYSFNVAPIFFAPLSVEWPNKRRRAVGLLAKVTNKRKREVTRIGKAIPIDLH